MLTNTVLDCIHARRSTRAFTDQQIAPEQLDALLDAAIWAPSDGNSQTWLFTAIQNRDILFTINRLVREGFQRWEPDDKYPGKLRTKKNSQNTDYNFFHHAPTLIIASNIPSYANAIADCALGLANIFLAAQSFGLGSCYINQLHWLNNDTSLRCYLAEMGIPREHVICSSAAVGHIALLSSPPARKEGTTHIHL